MLFPEFISELFEGKIYFISILYSASFFILTYYFTKIKLNIPNIKIFKFLGVFFNNKIEWFFIITFFISSIIFFFLYGISFRQSGEIMSDVGSIIYLNFATKAYVKIFIFKQIILCSNLNYKFPLFKLIIVFIAAILSISGSLDIMLPVIIFIFFLNRSLIYNDKKQSFSLYFFSILILILVPVVGTANKIGFESTYTFFSGNYEFIFKSILRRLSTWHQSVNYYIEIVYIEIIPYSFDLISDIFKTSINRFSILFGGARDIPEVHTAARYNFLNLLSYNSNPRTGTSPGVVATSLLFFPFGFFIFSFLLSRFYKFIYNLMPRNPSNFTHFFILLVILLPIIASPLDLIIIISPTLFFIIFLISLKYHLK